MAKPRTSGSREEGNLEKGVDTSGQNEEDLSSLGDFSPVFFKQGILIYPLGKELVIHRTPEYYQLKEYFDNLRRNRN